MRDIPVVVETKPHLSRADEARAQLRAASEALHYQAAEAHSEGMYLERQSARLESLAEGLDDDDALRIRDMFVKEGLLEIRSSTNAIGGQA